MNETTSAERIATAYHEAGHQVTAWSQELLIGPVSINPNSEANRAGVSCSEVVSAPPCDDLSARESLQCSYDSDQIVQLYAGRAAVERVSPEHAADGCWEDDEKAAELLQIHGLSERKLRERASDTVTKCWSQIEAVAEALLADEELDGEEVEMICLAFEERKNWKEQLELFRIYRRPLREGGKGRS